MTTYFYSIFAVLPANFHLFFFKPDTNTEKGFSPMLASPATLALPIRSTPRSEQNFVCDRDYDYSGKYCSVK